MVYTRISSLQRAVGAGSNLRLASKSGINIDAGFSINIGESCGGIHRMGERQNQPFQLTFTVASLGRLRFPRFHRWVTRYPPTELLIARGTGVSWTERLVDSVNSSRQCPSRSSGLEEHIAVPARFSPRDDLLRPHLRRCTQELSLGWIRGCERCRSDSHETPTFHRPLIAVPWEKNWDRGAALPSRLQTFETEVLAEEENFVMGRHFELNRELIGVGQRTQSIRRIQGSGLLDMD